MRAVAELPCRAGPATPCAGARFVFVGEKRSARAIRLGVRWQDGRLSGKTLHDALRAAGVDPAAELYLNVFREGESFRVDRSVVRRLRGLAASGLVVVGMGCKVQRALRRVGVEPVALVHPAARGVIRTRVLYQAHVAAVLGPHLAARTAACPDAQPRGPDNARRNDDAL